MTAAHAATPGMLDRLRFTVRAAALELNYHELGGCTISSRTPARWRA
jgi:hypothetical protein